MLLNKFKDVAMGVPIYSKLVPFANDVRLNFTLCEMSLQNKVEHTKCVFKGKRKRVLNSLLQFSLAGRHRLLVEGEYDATDEVFRVRQWRRVRPI